MRRSSVFAPVAIAALTFGGVARGEPGRPSGDERSRLPDLPNEYDVHEQDGFRVAYHPAARDRVRELLPRLPRIREELTARLGTQVLSEVEIRVAAMPIELDRLLPPAAARSGPDAGEQRSAEGYADAARRLVVLSLGPELRTAGEVEQTLRYTLAQIAVDEAAGAVPTRAASGDAGPHAPPTWYRLGFADHFAERDRLARLWQIEQSTLGPTAPSLSELAEASDRCVSPQADEACPRVRALAADFARFSEAQEARVPVLFARLRNGLSWPEALEGSFAADTATIERAWQRDAGKRHGWYPLVALIGLIGLLYGLVRALLSRKRARRGALAKEPTLAGQRRSFRRPLRRGAKVRPPVLRPAHGVPKIEHDGSWHTLH